MSFYKSHLSIHSILPTWCLIHQKYSFGEYTEKKYMAMSKTLLMKYLPANYNNKPTNKYLCIHSLVGETNLVGLTYCMMS